MVLGRRDLRGGRRVSKDLWMAGEKLTVLINEYHYTNSFKPLTKQTIVKTSTRWRRGTAPTPLNDDDWTTRQANHKIRYRWRRQAPEPHCNKEQYLWWRRDDPAPSPMQCIIGAFSLLWRQYRDCLHLATSTQHAEHIIWKPLLYSAEKLLKFCKVGAIKGGASGYGRMVLVLRFCGVCTLRCSPEHPGCSVLIWVRRMWVRVVYQFRPLGYTYFICIRTVILIGCSIILRWLVK